MKKTLLDDLEYASSLDKEQRGDGILRWASDYSSEDVKKLPKNKQARLKELLFRTINFLKQERASIGKNLINLEKIKKFL